MATSFNQILDAIRKVPRFASLQAEYFDMPPQIREFYQDYTCADLSAGKVGLGWSPRWKPADAITNYARMLAEDPRL
jgi:nucleoside-diphosphate-sugar epimerase